MLLALVGTLALTVSAKTQIPFWPVPMTMQTFVVLVIGMAYGARLGVATIALYLLEGALGLPVFAGTPEKGVGLAYMMGPTGGYLLGFVAGAWLCGWLAERGFDRLISGRPTLRREERFRSSPLLQAEKAPILLGKAHAPYQPCCSVPELSPEELEPAWSRTAAISAAMLEPPPEIRIFCTTVSLSSVVAR